MMGLALGVDYSLLIVSRFREELADGRDPWDAARGYPSQRRAHDALRRHDAVRRPRLLRLPAARLAAALAGDRDRRRHRDQRRSSRSSPCRRCWRCSASESTPGRSAAVDRRERADASLGRRRRRPRPCAARRSPRRWSRCRWSCSTAARRSPSPPAPPGSTSCRLEPGPAETPRRSTRPSAPAGRRPSSSSPPPSEARSPRRARLALLTRWQRRIAARAGRPGGDRPRRRSPAAPRHCARSGAKLTAEGADGPGGWTASGPACAAPPARSRELRGGLAAGAAGSGLLGRGLRTGRGRRRSDRRRAATRRRPRRRGERRRSTASRTGSERARRRPAPDRRSAASP